MGLIEKVFGNYSEKEIKRINPIIERIDQLGEELKKLSDEELAAKTPYFKEKLENGETLDDIMPEAYAVLREVNDRVTGGKRHFTVQLLGGVVLHQGRIAEMRTGEGKTQTALLPLYLNALSGKGAHLVTVNEYLAQYHAELAAEVFNSLGMSVGCIVHDLQTDERRIQYACDVTYATNNELGFDYLRDNMVVREEDRVQRGLNFAIIDEVDSILIDEARTPLIISGSGSKSTQLYKFADQFAKTLKKGRILNEQEALNPLLREELQEEGDYVVDEKQKTVTLTQEGIQKAERHFAVATLSDPDNMEILHHINNALKANYNMHLDIDYVVQDEEIVIVDEFTGRLMPGRRYSDGLHQAIEAKENVKVQRESKTLATITFQNFFNKYTKKAGMTGTALTEEGEFREIYGMDVVVIPTNRDMIRKDHSDVVYKTEAAKFRAVIKDVEASHSIGQPVLVGTVSIEKSEDISKLLKKSGIKHQVLNAKHHAQEAEIIALAGQQGAVTIATNMAGRGTDILLGEGVAQNGGLKIIGTERHESRRIDNQLRGRAGRQGDPGESRFYISLEDTLMRLFGGDKITKVVEMMGMEEDDEIEHKMLTKSIENAQKKVEGNNFGIRKHLLQYDQVMNEQREIIYGERNKVIAGADLRDSIMTMLKAVIGRAVESCTGESDLPEDWELGRLNEQLILIYHKPAVILSQEDKETLTRDQLKDRLYDQAVAIYERRENEVTPEIMRQAERALMLRVIDQKWMDHIDNMDQMRQSIGLRAYAQRDPLIEYKFQGFDMFEDMSNNIQGDTVRALYNVQVKQQEQVEMVQLVKKEDMFTNSSEGDTKKKPAKRDDAKVGRNDPCTCGSGKKFKQCCINKVG
ncbi:MAG: preprotein translocase subunit SecA [Defluviitaleaceae bacterium]|nr:preprotein translocase subunit SecA [Defluviitaleaceae bacterium]